MEFAAPDANELSEIVRSHLRIRCSTVDAAQTEELYQRLFLFVFQLLSQSGLKRLSKQALDDQVTVPTLAESDHALLRRLNERFRILEDRIDHVEAAVGGLGQQVQAVDKQQAGAFQRIEASLSEVLGLLSNQHSFSIRDLSEKPLRARDEWEAIATRELVVNEVSRMSSDRHLAGIETPAIAHFESPLLVSQLSPRTSKVEELAGLLARKDWLALYGSVNTGKTHLCELVAQQLGERGRWIRFSHSMSLPQASMVLQEAMRVVAGEPDASISKELYLKACEQLGSGQCLRLDDLPRMTSDDTLVDQLWLLADACRRARVKVISTSRHRLPTKLTTALAAEKLLEIPSPRFSDTEAKDVLVAHGAPVLFASEGTVNFINGLASGHPLLLTLASRFLRDAMWELDDKAFESLIRGDHAAGIADEVINRICQTLEVSQRELLYRLSLGIGAVKDSVAIELAGVPPTIDRPHECLATLVGAWIQRETSQRLVVSPLVRSIGSHNLSEATRRKCHVILGESIAKSPMDPWDAEIAIAHFVQASEFDRAGILFLMLLDRLRVWKPVPELRSVLSLWCDLPLPAQMDLGLRIKIRALQFWVFPRYAKSDDFVLSDLDQLMGEVSSDEAWSAHIVASLAALFLATRDFPRAIRYLIRSLTVLRHADIKSSELMIPRGKLPVELLWAVIVNISESQHLVQWLAACDELTAAERKVVIESKDAALGCVVLADCLMLKEMKRPTGEQNWSGVLESIQHLYVYAERVGWGHLAACALKSEVNVHGEFLKDVEVCDSNVATFVSDETRSQQARSLVAGMYGKMLAAAGKHDEALPWLERAIVAPLPQLPHDQMMTLLAAAKSSAPTDQGAAVGYAQGAAEIARQNRGISAIEATKAFGEHAIAVVSRNPTRDGAICAYPAWSEAARSMLVDAKRDDQWKDIFVLFAHIQNYFVQLPIFGEPPDRSVDGSPYATPRQGMFFTSHSQRIDHYRAEHIAGVLWFMSQYAWSAGDEESAAEWARRAIDATDCMPHSHVTASIKRDTIPDLLCGNAFADAMDAGIRGSESMVVQMEVVKVKPAAIPHDVPLDDLVAQLSDSGRKSVNRFAVVNAIIPALLRIAYVAMSDRETASDFATQMAALCRQSAKSTGDDQFYLGSASIFDEVSGDATVRDFYRLSNSFDASEYRELRVVGYLASTLAGQPEPAFRAQLAVMETVFSWYPPDSVVHAKLLLPYVDAYWRTIFQEKRFQFRSPSLVEQELANASAVKRPQRVRAILRAVKPAFSIGGLDDGLKWLERDD